MNAGASDRMPPKLYETRALKFGIQRKDFIFQGRGRGDDLKGRSRLEDICDHAVSPGRFRIRLIGVGIKAGPASPSQDFSVLGVHNQ